MKFRGLLVSVALLAVLGGLLYWSNRKQKGADAKPAADSGPKILAIPEDQIREVRIQKTGGENTLLRKGDDGKWQIVEPKPARADQDSVSSLVSTLSSLSADKLVEDKAADLAAYGFNQPALTVKVTKKDGKVDDLIIGDDVPTGSGSYARLGSDARVFTVAGYTKTNLDKSANDLRDKRLLTFDTEKLTRVDLQAKGQDLEFGKNNQNDWQILKPKPMRADGSQVEELVRKLKDAKMDSGGSGDDAKKAAAAFAGAARVALVTVSDAGGNQQLEVRKDKDKNYYAKSSVLEGVYKIGSELGDGMDKKPEDFRNKKLFDFGWTDPDKVEVRNGPAAPVTYHKSADKWLAGQKQVDGPSVQGFVDKLRELGATKVLDAGGGGGSPVFEATVTSNGGKRVEKVTVSRQGASIFAKRENEPGIYELDGKSVEGLQKAASEVKDYQPPKTK